ncbi:MAG: glucosaminidase domain-containing protein, partial [Tenacibaculum sp.]|nr:glucosaminidase domain-containing protein [Tenacibaculum sp.]
HKPIEQKHKPIVVEPIKKEEVKIPEVEVIKRERFKITSEDTKEYIQNFAPIAIKEMEQYKIPASITLAQGILESGSGRSALAVRSNNHFGIKCHRNWEGKKVTYDDDYIGECFRKYNHPKTSYEDHSKFLSTRKRYAKLFKLKITDYKGWAYGLKRAGYATDKRYPQKLIGLIKRYNLDKYDRMASVKVKDNQPISSNYYKVRKGDTLYSIATKHNISVERLKQINGLVDNIISIGQYLLIK